MTSTEEDARMAAVTIVKAAIVKAARTAYNDAADSVDAVVDAIWDTYDWEVVGLSLQEFIAARTDRRAAIKKVWTDLVDLPHWSPFARWAIATFSYPYPYPVFHLLDIDHPDITLAEVDGLARTYGWCEAYWGYDDDEDPDYGARARIVKDSPLAEKP